MARIPDDELEELKRNVSILHVCAAHGIELKRHGSRDYVGRCPFHEDAEPSFVVSPHKNLFHCPGCGAAGSVIDLVMKLDGLTFREAVDKLMTSTGVLSRAKAAKREESPSQSQTLAPERAARLLERVVAVYEQNLPDSPQAREYLKRRGLADSEQIKAHRAGYSAGRLLDILPKSGQVLDELKTLGILNASGAEHFARCIVFPVTDVDGNIVTLYGRHVAEATAAGSPGTGKRHVFLAKRQTGLWNAPAMKTYSELILVESILDALSVEIAGLPNVIAIQGTNGLNEKDIGLLKEHGVRKITLMLDGDEAGRKAAERLSQRSDIRGQMAVEIKQLPDGHDPNSFLMEHGPEKLGRFIREDNWGEAGLDEASKRAKEPSQVSPQLPATRAGAVDLAVVYGPRGYQILGLEKGPRKPLDGARGLRLRATLRVQHNGKLHVDTLDFYSARSRRILAQDLCRIFEETPEVIESDITRLVLECEKHEAKLETGNSKLEKPMMSAKEKTEAEAFGKSPNLIDRILADFETSGLVGEEPNKLLCYLAAVSRKMEEPLSVLVLSSSGAGKTALQDTALSFVPPEDLIKLTSLSGKALFYKERLSLKHKVLSLEEGDGAEEASYAIRNLISAGELVIESTIKDTGTGRLTTMENRVEGPTSVFLTTTDPDTDPETKSRFFVSSIDESKEQTQAILAFQRRGQTLEGLQGNIRLDAILRRHRNFQRLLKPLAVVNPHAGQLTYRDDRLQGRRDQPKYLNLIKAVAFLRQMTKPVERFRARGAETGRPPEYIEVDREDIRIANKLAHEILGRSLDELSSPGRALLLLLDEMVEQRVGAAGKEAEEYKPRRTNITFTRREIRDFTGWAHSRVHRYLKELVDLEYVLVDSGRNGAMYRYRLAYEGQGKDGSRFMLGLTDPDGLEPRKDG